MRRGERRGRGAGDARRDPNGCAFRITFVTTDLAAPSPRTDRRGPSLTADGRSLGVRRRTVTTSAGQVVVHADGAAGEVATILLHGAAGSWTTWTPLLRAAQRAGEPLTDVVAIDLPGWGESAAPAGGWDVAQLGDAVAEVAESLGYRRWILVGHSLGGFLALDIAARLRERTDAVLLISPSGPAVLDAIRHPVRGGWSLPGFAGMLLAMRVLAAMGGAGRRFLRALRGSGLLGPLSAPLFAEPARVHRSVVAALADEVRPRACAEAARAAAGYDETQWSGIRCPVRALRGERDVFVADSDGAALAALIPDFAQQTVAGAGHFAAVERPDAVRGVLRSLPSARVFALGESRGGHRAALPPGADARRRNRGCSARRGAPTGS